MFVDEQKAREEVKTVAVPVYADMERQRLIATLDVPFANDETADQWSRAGVALSLKDWCSLLTVVDGSSFQTNGWIAKSPRGYVPIFYLATVADVEKLQLVTVVQEPESNDSMFSCHHQFYQYNATFKRYLTHPSGDK